MSEYTKSQVISDLKCKGIEAAYISSLLNKGISKQYLYENYIYNYQKNIDVMKNNKIYLEDYFKNYNEKESPSDSRKRFENFNDDCSKALIAQHAKKLIRCISSHKKIFNEKTYQYFHTLAELKVDVEFIKNNVGKKIKAINTTEELNKTLKTHIDTFSDWDLGAKLSIIKQNNTHIISTQNNKIIFEVEDYESSRNLGSPMWCITRDNEDFENYRKDSDRIMFCYDFNKEAEDNEHKTAYIVNAQGNVTSGYFNDDSIMNKDKYSQYQDYFDKYTEEEFLYRLENKNYSFEYQILLLIANEFEENISEMIEESNFNNLSEEKFRNFIGKNNEEAIFKIINKYPEILLPENNKGNLINTLMTYAEEVNYSEMGCKIITQVISSEELSKEAFKNKIKYTEDIIHNISLSGYESEEQIKVLASNKNYDLKKDIKKLTSLHFGKRVFELFELLEEDFKLKNFIKENKNVVFEMINCHQNAEAFKYLSLNKDNDIELIEYLVNEFNNKKDKISESRQYEISKQLANLSNNADEEVKKAIKLNILKRPRNLFSMRKDVAENEVVFSKEETLNICSGLIFEEKYDNAKKLDKIDKYEDLLIFRLPEPFIKGIFGSSSLDSEGLSEFINFIKDKEILNQCKTDVEKHQIETKIKMIESHSTIDFLNNKIEKLEKKPKRKNKII